MPPQAYRVGAVVYHEKVRQIWDAFGDADLRGARVGFGDADSPQAHILPVHVLLQEGVDPRTDFVATRLDRDLGMHGDTGGAELAQLGRVRSGELDACVVSSVTSTATHARRQHAKEN